MYARYHIPTALSDSLQLIYTGSEDGYDAAFSVSGSREGRYDLHLNVGDDATLDGYKIHLVKTDQTGASIEVTKP